MEAPRRAEANWSKRLFWLIVVLVVLVLVALVLTYLGAQALERET